MGKRHQPHIIPEKGILTKPFEPFYGSPLEPGTVCDIMGEDDDRYIVSFMVVGYAGTVHIRKTFIEKVIIKPCYPPPFKIPIVKRKMSKIPGPEKCAGTIMQNK